MQTIFVNAIVYGHVSATGITTNSSYALTGPPGWFNAGPGGGGAGSRGAAVLLTPNPDYFVALLYRSLVGKEILHTTATDHHTNSGARFHSACGPNRTGVVTWFINPTREPLSVVYQFAQPPAQTVNLDLVADLYLLQAPDDNLAADISLLNGVALNATTKLTPQQQSFPPGTPASFVFPKYSYGFVAFPELTTGVCSS